MPLFAHHLPQYTGQYPVGTIDIEAPLVKPRVIHDARLKETGQQAFKLETVLFTLYYPATKARSARPKHYWVPKPLSLTGEGYARFAHINNYVTNNIFTGALGLIAGTITIPASVDVPLATSSLPSSRYPDAEKYIPHTETSEGLPVIVFSHGMASSRTDYTHYIGELASRGFVVAAIEHRDGSSPGTIISYRGDRPHRPVLHFGMKDVNCKLEMDMPSFKQAQLDFRQAEIEETVRVLKLINAGHGREVFSFNSRNEGADLPNWRGKLDTTSMIVAGHSYGATGALQALSAGPHSANLPFSAAIILDPGKQSGPLNADISVPILIVHSNSWSSHRSIFQGRPHFDVVRDLAQGVNDRAARDVDASTHPKMAAWFMTSLGTSHPSVTDAPLLEPLLLSWTTGASIDVQEAVRQYVHVSEDFLGYLRDGRRRGLLALAPEFPEYDPGGGDGHGKERKDVEGDFKRFWQVHVAPPVDVGGDEKVWSEK